MIKAIKLDLTGKVAAILSLSVLLPAIIVSLSTPIRTELLLGNARQGESSQSIRAGSISGAQYDTMMGNSEWFSPARGYLINKIAGISSTAGKTSSKNVLLPKRILAEKLSATYMIVPAAAENFVNSAFDAGIKHGVDPLLILAICAAESRFNPVAMSRGGAMGLMQIIPKYHADVISGSGGMEGLVDTKRATYAGAQILRQYLNKAQGNLEVALSLYNGSISDLDRKYAKKVLGLRSAFNAALLR